MITATDLRRLNRAELAVAERDAEIVRLLGEIEALRAHIERLTKENEGC